MIKRYHTLGLHEKETKHPTDEKKQISQWFF